MKGLAQVGLLVMLASTLLPATDAAPREVKKVEVFPSASEVRVEITLSAAAVPSVETAQHPDRLVVKLPGTASPAQQKRISVQQLGVRAVRFGLNRSDPPETHVVVDLDEEHPYKVAIDGARIILSIQPSLRAEARKRNAPAGAASRPLINSLSRGAQSDNAAPSGQRGSDGAVLTPPPSGPPIPFPSAGTAASSTDTATTASGDQPSARRPNRASLQEGTVFPGAGSPGTGDVPPVSGTPPTNTLPATGTPGAADAAAATSPITPQPVPKEPSTTSLVAGSPSSVTATAAPGSAPAPSLPEEPKRSAAPPAEQATPAQKASETSVPSGSEQVREEKPDGATAATAEPVSNEAVGGEGSGKGQVQPAGRREGENPDVRTAFRVKYVVQDSAYLDGGRAVGLSEGMKLVVRDLPNAGGVATEGADSSAAGDVAELQVISVAENSAVTEIRQPKRPVRIGDLAYLSAADQQAMVEKNALSATRKYPAVVSFTENDTLDEEARAEVPKPPSPAVNRSRGRIGFNYMGVLDHGTSNMYTSDVGLVSRIDITRIGGTYWNASGYWNGRFDHTTNAGPQTLQDLINRTYTLYTNYDNPNSAWVAGFGRMYLPWATSLDTIDGGYAGRKLKQNVTSGIFLGSTPDPTSWSYAPGRQIGGAFINFEGGSYEDLHYTSTAGAGLQMLSWTPDRPFVFFENGISYKRVFSIYQASQIDSHAAHTFQTSTGTFVQAGTSWGLGRSFTTVRFLPHPRIEFSMNHTYYRDLPYVDPSSITSAGIAAGLFDKFLTQGTMGGVRVEVLKQIWLSADLGMSSHSGESKSSLNQMFGITFGHVPWINAHMDARYSKFNSTFGSGSYEALAFTRNLTEGLQLQVLAGQQNFSSTLTSANHSRFVNGMIESNVGKHYFVQVGGTISRGNQMSYDQWMFTFGYRFDNRQGQKPR